MHQQIAFAEIERWREQLDRLALDIWEHPEGPYREYQACEWTAQLLRDAGFDVEVGVGGIKTAIRATYGSGKPVFGLLGEYDALPGMSQKVCTHKEPVVDGGWGHACGHNLLGVAHAGAAIGLKKAMEEGKLPGTVIYFGCPAEEVLTGKALMARAHVFDGIDFCAAFHPNPMNQVLLGTATGLNSFKLHFKGRTAHAGCDPHNGRSALDAVELTNVGINYLREHVPTSVRIHYVITEGGVAPNIVPDKACAWYFVRALTREVIDDVYGRVLDIARGAALMTGTTLEVEFLGGCYPTLNNQVLGQVMYDSLCETPHDLWTQEELNFAAALNGDKKLDEPIHTGVVQSRDNCYGSTDVGDVQHIAPGIAFDGACWNMGAPGHHWQVTACAGHSIGLKGMIYAAKAMALFGLKVMSDPELLAQAKKEFDEKMEGKPYVCPIPDEVPVPDQD